MVSSAGIAAAIVAPPALPRAAAAAVAATTTAGAPFPAAVVCTHTSVWLCEACNGIAISLLMQSMWACVLSCFLPRSLSARRASVCASLMLFLYSTILVRINVVACCFYSGEPVAEDIMWCSTQQPRNASAWESNCRDTSGALRLFFGTSVAIQTALVVGLAWGLHRWRCVSRCRRWCRRGDDDRGRTRRAPLSVSSVVRSTLHAHDTV